MAEHHYASLSFEEVLESTTPLSEMFDPTNYPDHQSAPIDYALHYGPPYPSTLHAYEAAEFISSAAAAPDYSQAEKAYDALIDNILSVSPSSKSDELKELPHTINVADQNEPLHRGYPPTELASLPTPESTHSHNNHNKGPKTGASRATCEGCRKLHVKCIPSPESNRCEKCTKKGRDCVFLPRAEYGSKTKTNN